MGLSTADVMRASRLIEDIREARRAQKSLMLAENLSAKIFRDAAGSDRAFLSALGISESEAEIELASFWTNKLSQRIADLEKRLRDMGVEP